MSRTKPSFFQLVGYCLGKRLPDSMLDWVRNDLAGPGATRRLMLRVLIPAVLVLAPFWLIPTTLYVHLSMTVPILIPFVYFSHALNKIGPGSQVILLLAPRNSEIPAEPGKGTRFGLPGDLSGLYG